MDTEVDVDYAPWVKNYKSLIVGVWGEGRENGLKVLYC